MEWVTNESMNLMTREQRTKLNGTKEQRRQENDRISKDWNLHERLLGNEERIKVEKDPDYYN